MKLLFELKYTLRLLQKNIWHSILCAVIVAMCIAISWTAISVFYHAELKPVPFADATRWVAIETVDKEISADAIQSQDEFLHQYVEENLDGFEHIGGYVFQAASLNVDSLSQRVNRLSVDPNLFDATGILPALGRSFTRQDRESPNQHIAIISYDIWINTFASTQNIIGEQIFIDNQAHTIVGVMGENSHVIADFDVYTPFLPHIALQPGDSSTLVSTIGKLLPGVSRSSVDLELTNLLDGLREQYPEFYSQSLEARLVPLNDLFKVSGGNDWLFATFGLIVFTMTALGCISIGNLLIARVLERQQEFALRNALGSSRTRLMRQSLLESFLICLVGSIVGFALSFLAGFGMVQLLDEAEYGRNIGTLPVDLSPSLLPIEFLFLGTLILGVWLACGIVPAFRASRQDPATALSGSSIGSLNTGSFSATKILVGFQIVCTCFALVVCAGGIYGIALTRTTDFGFSTDTIITANIDLPAERFDHNARLSFLDSMSTELENSPSIQAHAFSSNVPGSFPSIIEFSTADTLQGRNDQLQLSRIIQVTPAYFPTLGIDIVSGRNFVIEDNTSSLPVALVNAELAERLWPNESALGKQIQLDPENSNRTITVVGTVTGVSAVNAANRILASIYLPISQDSPSSLRLLARTTASAEQANAEVTAAAINVDRSVPPYRQLTMEQFLTSAEANNILVRNSFITISIAALIMAITGIYGVVSRSILIRVREIGVRRALGSTNWRIIRLFLKHSTSFLVAGCLLGGLPATAILAALIAEIDGAIRIILPVFFLVISGLALFILLATYIPTRNAIALEPGDALRHE